jgi:hypothetical protein
LPLEKVVEHLEKSRRKSTIIESPEVTIESSYDSGRRFTVDSKKEK